MIHEVIAVGVLRCNCSIFGDEASREAIVVDPGANVEAITDILTKHRLSLKAIVITHAHIDHIGGAEKLRTLTGAPVWMNQADEVIARSLALQAAWVGVPEPKNPGIDKPAKEGDVLNLGAAEFHVIDTPGHTPGSVSLFIPAEGKLISGDTLFLDTVGRTDLPGGSSRDILKSIRNKLFVLPEETIVIPGHGQNTTIGHEKIFNPFAGASAPS